MDDDNDMCLSPAIYEQLIRNKDTKFRLSRNFTVGEMIATSRRIDNWPKEALLLYRMHNLCRNVLQKVRDHYGKPIKVSSGYRSPELNRLIGGSSRSQHSRGQAADFEVRGVDNRDLARWIHSNLNFDQLILEFYTSSQGMDSGWVHCSYKMSGNRKQFLIAKKKNKKTIYLPATISRLDSL